LITDINAANKAGGSNTITLAANTTFDLTKVKSNADLQDYEIGNRTRSGSVPSEGGRHESDPREAASAPNVARIAVSAIRGMMSPAAVSSALRNPGTSADSPARSVTL
jgi:hypothetical protein